MKGFRDEPTRENTAKPAATKYIPRRFTWSFDPSVLRAERRAVRMGLRSLARRVGVSMSTLHRWEHGACVPMTDRLLLWCNSLQVDPAECFKCREV